MSQAFIDLVRLFDDLPAPAANAGTGRFSAAPVTDFPACTVGKDPSGNPAILIEADNAQAGVGAPVVLERMSVMHLVKCRVMAAGGGEGERMLSVIRCTVNERSFHEYFLRSLYPIMASLPAYPSRQQISQAIDRLIELFQKMSQTPGKTLTGLWAELFVIARGRDPHFLLGSWHVEAEDRFDFGAGSDRIEVKAAQGRHRVHHFSLEQLRPSAGARTMIATVLVEHVQGGSSINDLVDVIRSRVSEPELLLHLDSIVAQIVGQDWRGLKDTRFDRQLASESMKLIDASTVPAVATPVPPEISDVHFRVDLSGHDLPFPEALVRDSRLFSSASQ